MTDDRNQPAQPAFRMAGVGHAGTFLCARCITPKQTFGRRMQAVKGLRTWVCKGCVIPKGGKA